MGQESPPESPEAGGLVAAARKFAAAVARWAAARLRLVSAESRDAGARMVKVLIAVCALMLCAAFGWLFLCIAAVLALGRMIGGAGGVAWAALIAGLGHLTVAALLAKWMKGRASQPLFPLTTEELKKDQAWLEAQKEKR